VRALPFEHEAHHRVLVDQVHAVDEARARIARLDKDIAELVERWSLKPLVQALQGLRGMRLLTAVVLAAELGDANLGVIDASWHLPNAGRIGATEFRMKHIPGAVFFDIDGPA